MSDTLKSAANGLRARLADLERQASRLRSAISALGNVNNGDTPTKTTKPVIRRHPRRRFRVVCDACLKHFLSVRRKPTNGEYIFCHNPCKSSPERRAEIAARKAVEARSVRGTTIVSGDPLHVG